jgi:tellurite resistance protein
VSCMRMPPNFFGIAFGFAGLSEAWNESRAVISVPAAIPAAIAVLAAVSWLVLLACYLAQGWTPIAADLRDPVLAPFVPIAVITPMILSAELVAFAPGAARMLVVVFLAATVALGGWMTGQWMIGDLPRDACHPGYFLPALPPALVPTLAIEDGPPVVAGVAYFQLSGGALNAISLALGGYAVLMVAAQLRFVPGFARLKFTPGFWAFTFLLLRGCRRRQFTISQHQSCVILPMRRRALRP